MGRRFYLGLGLLVLFLISGLLVTFGLARVHGPTAEAFSQAAEAALEGNLSQGIALARQAKDRWLQFRRATASVADHTPMDEIEGLLAEAEVFAGAEDAEHFAACCAKLARLVQGIADAHSPDWENIL